MSKCFLAIDPSTSHAAYTFGTIDGTSVEITEVGMMWTKTSWTRGQKFNYMFKSLEYLINKYPGTPYTILTESYFSNPKLPQGQSSIPAVNAFIEAIVSRDTRMTFEEMGPPVWRSIIQLKPIKDPVTLRKDFKGPAKAYVEKLLAPLPENIKSNMTLKDRTTPTDVADSMCIALAFAKRAGCTEFSIGRCAFLPLTLIEELNKISQTI